MKTVTVVGLGYVGLPLACLCAEKDYKVYGLDTNQNKVDLINKVISPIEDEYIINKLKNIKGRINAIIDASKCIPNSDIVIVCVPTPIDKNNSPDLTALMESLVTISKYIKQNTLLIIESTIYPGTTEEVMILILKKQGFDAYKNNIFVAHCPERIDPGNKKWTIENLPRVVGGVTKEATKKAAEFYRSIVNADVIELSSIKAAEATKIMENTFRDVNIAFVNEMAKSFDKAGIDIVEVIKAASTKPFAFLPHYPGAGVGGHCFDRNEWIFVKYEDSVYPIKIGELYELLKYYNEIEIGKTKLVNPGNLEVLSFDLNNKKSCYKPLKLLSKRAYSNMLRIRAVGNYSIKLTDKHPVVVFNNELKIKTAEELNRNDKLVVSLELPETKKEINNVKKIITSHDIEVFDTFAVLKIKNIEELQGDFVYSLEVEDTGTVVTTNGLVMHNCIPVDPYYLIEKAKQIGFNHEFLKLAREINKSMPSYTVELLENELKKLKKSIKNSKVGILGLAYKANVDDMRESPAFDMINILKTKGAEVFVFDPHVKTGSNVKDLDELLQRSDYIILVTEHNEFKNMDLSKLKKYKILVVIDGRNCLDKEKIKGMKILYHGVGRS